MSNVTTWAKDAALRAVKTGAQAAAAAITANTATITHLDFAAIGSIAGLAAVWSVLQNLSHLKVADPDADALVQAVLAKVEASVPKPAPSVMNVYSATPVDAAQATADAVAKATV